MLHKIVVLPVNELRILADENIPLTEHLFGTLGQVRTMPAGSIDVAAVRLCDVLLVRSVTRVDSALLAESPVRFVGSATIGTDHVDLEYLAAAGITFAHAPGSNAGSVVEYVLASLLEASLDAGRPLSGRTLGVVGYGNIGRRLAERVAALGMRVIANDPPRSGRGERAVDGSPFVTLDAILAESDFVSLHVPYTRLGPHPTHHLINHEELGRMRPDATLINTSRGAVVNGSALRGHLESKPHSRAVLDVYEGEPRPDVDLVRHLFIATPHIAGYSVDGKRKGAVMLYDALCAHLGEEPDPVLREFDSEPVHIDPPADCDRATWLACLVRRMYDIRADDRRMRAILELPSEDRASQFTQLRKTYPDRRAFEMHVIDRECVPKELRRLVTEAFLVRLS